MTDTHDTITRLDSTDSEIDFDTFAGVYPAMPTPFDEDGDVVLDRLAEDARRLDEAGVAGLVPVGSTGESATLTHDEHA
ncbi:MAG: dihydrodipicolinate synthase family protein, partial [Halobaculum sp.]